MKDDAGNQPIFRNNQAGDRRWQQVLAFGCLPEDGSVAPNGQAAAPAVPASDVIP